MRGAAAAIVLLSSFFGYFSVTTKRLHVVHCIEMTKSTWIDRAQEVAKCAVICAQLQ